MLSRRTVEVWQRYGWAILLVGILALAAFYRFWHLSTLPPGLHPDEAANGLDVFSILEHHNIQPFYPSNGGREGLFFLLQAIGVGMFGNSIWALRLAPAVLSTLAVGAVYLWATSWFNRRTGLIAAFIMAVTPWAITIGRDGFRGSMMALMVPLVLWLYTKAIQAGRLWWWALAGLALGTGFYTYIAFRLFPLALVAAAVYLLIWHRTLFRKLLSGFAVSAVVAAITVLPLGLYALHHPGDIIGRPSGVSFTNPHLNHGKPLQTLADTTLKTALMFNVHGDENYRQNLGGQPELNFFVGIMFLLGVLFCLAHIGRPRYFGLLLILAVMLLPEILTAEGIPHALRAMGALPAAVVLAAVGIVYLLESWYKVFPINSAARVGGLAAILVLLAMSAYQGYVQYFVAWAHSQATYDAYAEDSATLGRYLNTHPFAGSVYAVAGSYQMMTVDYITHHKATYTRIEPTNVKNLPLNPHQAKEFTIFEHDKAAVITQLKLKYPNGRVSPHYSSFSGNELFVTYTVPAS